MDIHVSNLCDKLTENDLKDIFSRYGTVLGSKIIIDPYTRQRRDFGFITMSTREDGLKALSQLNGKEVNNRQLIVKEILE